MPLNIVVTAACATRTSAKANVTSPTLQSVKSLPGRSLDLIVIADNSSVGEGRLSSRRREFIRQVRTKIEHFLN